MSSEGLYHLSIYMIEWYVMSLRYHYSVAKMIREYSSLLRRGNGYTFVAKLERGISTEDALKDNWFLE